MPDFAELYRPVSTGPALPRLEVPDLVHGAEAEKDPGHRAVIEDQPGIGSRVPSCDGQDIPPDGWKFSSRLCALGYGC